MEEADGLAREREAQAQRDSLGYIDLPCKNMGEGGSSPSPKQTTMTNTKKSLDLGRGDELL